ncbi:DUF4344 domain-containing metallopeptidase [Novispirillum itersonii]|uniref:DUF4344 domain-containing metallopeptidase n=1 Tax=Novispirillum itersonii TaxID=189 RepID=UPI0009DC1F6B|nr:DUF4344 domain-containing metallopeptidase [Novispirillum itersonii]
MLRGLQAMAVGVLLGLMLPGGAVWAAGAKTPAPQKTPRQAPEMEPEVRTFILGNTLFTLYHEVGHALIHELQLPVLGREEDAVDNLASLLMVPEEDDPEMLEMVMAAAQGWLMSAAAGDDEEELAFWDEHGLDMQRFYSVVCMLYGSDPDRFSAFADDAELPDYRRDSCPQEFDQVSTSWATLLDPHLLEDGGRKSRVKVVYEPPAPAYRTLSAMLKQSRMVERLADDIRTSFVLPRELTLRVAACDEANAYYDPEDSSVTLCYELLEEYETLIRADLEAAE